MHKLLVILIALITFKTFATDLSVLSRSEREQLYQGKLILKSYEVADQAWPRVEVFALIESEVLEFAAFFCDFERQTEYIPDLLKAKMLEHEDTLNIPIEYEMHLPFPLSNAQYTHTHVLQKKSDDSYSVSWSVISSSVAEKVSGSSLFIPSAGKTLWHYSSHVTPKSALAGFFSSSMKSDTLKSLEATKQAFLDFKKANPKALQEMALAFSKKFLDSTK
tara:strand:+ start:27578 stop:28237 length:660 start_codon:yes stop_codon:yes gene_type:complete